MLSPECLQEARLEGLPYAQSLGQDSVIRRKDGGVHSTNAQTKNVAGNMFQGIFIADCSSEVFLPEHSVDTRYGSFRLMFHIEIYISEVEIF